MRRYRNRKRRTRNRLAAALGAFLLARFKSFLAYVQLGKTGSAILSMLVAAAIYAWFYQWEFALGLTVMVLLHELGHIAAARQKGIPVTAPFFIPFLGALIMLKRNPRDAVTEAYVAFGGPLVGTAAALVSFLIGWASGNTLFLAIAYIGFILNLINLLPIHPLDGGRIASTVTRWLWAAGLIGGIFIVLSLKSLLFFVIWALFAWDMFVKYVRDKGNTRQYMYWGKIEVPYTDMPGDTWMLEPLREKEPLPYRTYSRLSDGSQWVDIVWEQAATEAPVKMPEQAIIRSVESTKAERRWKHTPKIVVLRYQIDYLPHVNEHYYAGRPRSIRWKFGIAYGALTLFLIGMMYAVQNIMAIEGGFLHLLKR